MEKIVKKSVKGKEFFMGIDVHGRTWRVSGFHEGEELVNQEMPSDYKHMRRFLERYQDFRVHAVYEAGPFGYLLYDRCRRMGLMSL